MPWNGKTTRRDRKRRHRSKRGKLDRLYREMVNLCGEFAWFTFSTPPGYFDFLPGTAPANRATHLTANLRDISGFVEYEK